MYSVPFVCPTSICISGCSGSGKSFFTHRLLKNRDVMFTIPVKKIIWFYNIWQKLYDEVESSLDVDFQEGLPTEHFLKEINDGNHYIIVLDDLQDQITKSNLCERLLTQISHHNCITVIYLVQNFFNKNMRTLTLNSHYLILFRNLRDVTQISTLSRQIGLGKGMIEAYKDATSEPYSYLCVDLCPHSTDEQLRLRSKIFPDEYTIVYLVK